MCNGNVHETRKPVFIFWGISFSRQSTPLYFPCGKSSMGLCVPYYPYGHRGAEPVMSLYARRPLYAKPAAPVAAGKYQTVFYSKQISRRSTFHDVTLSRSRSGDLQMPLLSNQDCWVLLKHKVTLAPGVISPIVNL